MHIFTGRKAAGEELAYDHVLEAEGMPAFLAGTAYTSALTRSAERTACACQGAGEEPGGGQLGGGSVTATGHSLCTGTKD